MATAYAALISLLNDLDLIQNHPRHSFSFDNNQIQSLLERVCFLIDFMETCDYHQAEEAEALENEITVAAHAAEDVILSHVANQLRSGYSRIRFRWYFLHQIHGGSLDLQEAIEGMEFVRRKAIKIHKRGFKLDQPTITSTTATATPSRHLTSQKNNMVGFDEVLYQLLDLLIGEAGRLVIPIIAMAGAGDQFVSCYSDQVEEATKKLETTVSVNPGRDHADPLFHESYITVPYGSLMVLLLS